MPGHGCPGPGCDVIVPRSQLACRSHWYALPKPLRDKVWSAYRREPQGKEHMTAVAEAIAYLHDERQ